MHAATIDCSLGLVAPAASGFGPVAATMVVGGLGGGAGMIAEGVGAGAEFGAAGGTAAAAGVGVSMSEPFSASKSGLLKRNVPVFPSSVAFHISSGVLLPIVSLPL